MGGHPVPEQKIIERYYRSMDLLMQAIECCDRAYLFDNSSDGIQASFLAEIEAAETLKMNAAVSEAPKMVCRTGIIRISINCSEKEQVISSLFMCLPA